MRMNHSMCLEIIYEVTENQELVQRNLINVNLNEIKTLKQLILEDEEDVIFDNSRVLVYDQNHEEIGWQKIQMQDQNCFLYKNADFVVKNLFGQFSILKQTEQRYRLKIRLTKNQVALQVSDEDFLEQQLLLLKQDIIAEAKKQDDIIDRRISQFVHTNVKEIQQELQAKDIKKFKDKIEIIQQRLNDISQINYEQLYQEFFQKEMSPDTSTRNTSQSQLKSMPSFKEDQSLPLLWRNTTPESIDFVYFYSRPLGKRNNFSNEIQPLNNNLNTHDQYEKVLSILRDQGKQFRIIKDPINFESFKQVVAKSPKIIHISCHADYDAQANEFYLQFEEYGTGLVDKFNQARLNALIGKNHSLQIAFVSAQLSDKVGQIFKDAKIPVIIVVNQENLEKDDVCTLFMSYFYKYLLQGCSVQESFIEAQEAVRASKVNYTSCCCAHSHTAQCRWYQFALKEGFQKAHQVHSGNCKSGNVGNKHQKQCQVLRDFKSFQALSEKSNFKAAEFNKSSIFDQFFHEIHEVSNVEEILSLDQHQGIVCCCKHELYHDERLKFKIIASDDNMSISPFKDTPAGKLIEASTFQPQITIPMISNQYKVFLRNDIIQKSFEIMTSINEKGGRMLIIKGKQGVGKSSLAREAIKYAIDRNFFQDGAFYVDGSLEIDFFDQLARNFGTDFQDENELIRFLKHNNIVIYFENAEQMIWKSPLHKEFHLINRIITETTNICFVIEGNGSNDPKQDYFKFNQFYDQVNQKDNENLNPLYYNVKYVFIHPFNNEESAQILKELDVENQIIQISYKKLREHPILQQELTPNQLNEIYMLLKIEKNLDSITWVQSDISNDLSLMQQYILQKTFEKLDALYRNQLELVFCLAQSPLGMSQQNIDELIEKLQDKEKKHELFTKLIFDYSSQILIEQQQKDEIIYFVKPKVRNFINKNLLEKRLPHFFFKFIDFMSELGRKYLKKFSEILNKSQFDIQILSARIEYGLWQKAIYSPLDFLRSNKKIEHNQDLETLVNHFEIDIKNFEEVINLSILSNIYGQKIEPWVIRALDETCVTYASILIVLDRKEAFENAYNQMIAISDHFKLKLLKGKLMLMKLSMGIQKYQKEKVKQRIDKLKVLFKEQLSKKGLQETEYLEEEFHYKSIRQLIKNLISYIQAQSVGQEDEKVIFGDNKMIDTEFTTPKKVYDEIINGKFKLFDNQSSQIAIETYFSFSINRMQRQEKLKNELGIAKVLYQSLSGHLDIESYTIFEQLIPAQLKAKLLMEFVGQIQTACQTFLDLNLHYHFIKFNRSLAYCYFQIQRYDEAIKILRKSLSLAQQTNDQDQITSIKHEMNEIFTQIHKNAKNIIITSKASPIVENGEELPGYLTNIMGFYKYNFTYYFRKKFGKYKSKVEVLNLHLLNVIREMGCNTLIIEQECYDFKNKYLCIENDVGEIVKLSPKQLKKILKPKEGTLNIHMLFLQIPDSHAIASVFAELGVSQIFIFGNPFKNYPLEILNEEDMYQTDYLMRCETFWGTFLNKLICDHWTISESYEHCLKITPAEWFKGQDQGEEKIIQPEDEGIQNISSVIGRSNYKLYYGMVYWGHKKEIHKALKHLHSEDQSPLHVTGLGKTRFLNEVAKHLDLRGKFNDGIFYFDLQDVVDSQDLRSLFQKQNLCFLLQNPTSEKQRNMLIIYDNADKLIVRSPNFFNWHLEKVQSHSSYLKTIISSSELKFQGKKIQLNKLDELTTLKFIRCYALRPLRDFNEKDEKLKLCDGNPKVLIKLCLILRMYSIRKIQIVKSNQQKVQIKYKFKSGRLQLVDLEKPELYEIENSLFYPFDLIEKLNNNQIAITNTFLKLNSKLHIKKTNEILKVEPENEDEEVEQIILIIP